MVVGIFTNENKVLERNAYGDIGIVDGYEIEFQRARNTVCPASNSIVNLSEWNEWKTGRLEKKQIQ